MSSDFRHLYIKVAEAVTRCGMIRDGDRILCGISGGLDSMVMFLALSELRKTAPVKFTLTGAVFDPGYPGFDTAAVEKFCRSCGGDFASVKMDMASLIAEKKWEKSPCVLCSRLRRGKLYGLAGELGCNSLALGHHLDDALASFFMSLCRGQGISSMAPVVEAKSDRAVRIIRPMIYAPEKLVKSAAAECGITPGGDCPYKEQLLRSGDREYFRRLTDTLAEKIPDVRANILHSFGRVECDHLPGF